MKYFLIILVLNIIPKISFSQKVNCDLSISGAVIVQSNEGKFLTLKATLKNDSNETIDYLSKTCSYEEFYFDNSKYLEIQGSDCDKNIGTIFFLEPKQSRTVILKFKILAKSRKLKLKVGFKLIPISGKDLSFHSAEKLKIIKVLSNQIEIII